MLTKILLYGTTHRIGKTDKISVQLNNIEIKEVKEDNYLGLLFDLTLTWHNYADKLSAKISKHLGVFKQVTY